MSKKTTIIVVAYPDRGAGNDPEPFLTSRGRMSSERYCHTPGVVVIIVVVVVVVVVDSFRLKFLFINLSQVKVSVY